MSDVKAIIARRVAKELENGMLVNLGIGLPTLVANYLPPEVNILFQSENGFVGLGPAPKVGEEDLDLTNAGAQPVTIQKGGMFFDSAYSFAIIRGGHLDATVLGALQVDREGNLANWMIPGEMVPGMGGAMDLVGGTKKVIVAMTHTAKGGEHKILEACTLPLTAVGKVSLIITEMGVMEVTAEGIVLKEIHPAYSIEAVQAATGVPLIIPENLGHMQ